MPNGMARPVRSWAHPVQWMQWLRLSGSGKGGEKCGGSSIQEVERAGASLIDVGKEKPQFPLCAMEQLGSPRQESTPDLGKEEKQSVGFCCGSLDSGRFLGGRRMWRHPWFKIT